MTTYELLFFAGLAAAVPFILLLITGRTGAGQWQIAALLSALFLAYSLIPILREGPIGFVANHTASHWGVQVFWDLLLALCMALFLAAPRARKVGMNLALWVVPVLLLGSIGMLALLARLFWLEQRQTAAA
jgi:hypothetical protein